MKSRKIPSSVAFQALTSIAFSLLLVVAWVWFTHIPSPATDKRKSEKEMSDTEKREHRSHFYENTLKPIIESIVEERWVISAVNERHHALTTTITNRYKQPNIDVEIALEYSDETKAAQILALAYVADGGTPTIRIYVPTAIRFYNGLAETGDPLWQTKFAYGIAIGFIHELDHLELGLFPTEPGINLKSAERLAVESKAYARTCEHLIKPLVETHRISLDRENQELYAVWELSGRNETSPIWREAIRKRHE